MLNLFLFLITFIFTFLLRLCILRVILAVFRIPQIELHCLLLTALFLFLLFLFFEGDLLGFNLFFLYLLSIWDLSFNLLLEIAHEFRHRLVKHIWLVFLWLLSILLFLNQMLSILQPYLCENQVQINFFWFVYEGLLRWFIVLKGWRAHQW